MIDGYLSTPYSLRSSNRNTLVRMRPTRCNNSDLLLINSISTCFGHLHAHRQDVQDVCTVWRMLPTGNILHTDAHILPTDSPASQQLQQDRHL